MKNIIITILVLLLSLTSCKEKEDMNKKYHWVAYVKRIVKYHDGEVYAESEKGKGSTFVIKLPLII